MWATVADEGLIDSEKFGAGVAVGVGICVGVGVMLGVGVTVGVGVAFTAVGVG